MAGLPITTSQSTLSLDLRSGWLLVADDVGFANLRQRASHGLVQQVFVDQRSGNGGGRIGECVDAIGGVDE